MFKELHVVARFLYSLATALAFQGVSGLPPSVIVVLSDSLMIFVFSFMFQYYVLHFVLKNTITIPRNRVRFIMGFLVLCVAGLIISGLMISKVQSLEVYVNVDDLTHGEILLWASAFIVFSSAFVATACTRRAFDRHGALG